MSAPATPAAGEAPCTTEALGIHADAMAPPTIRFCDGTWALYDPGVPGDGSAIYQASGATWERHIQFPNTLCRSDYASEGVPAELLALITITC